MFGRHSPAAAGAAAAGGAAAAFVVVATDEEQIEAGQNESLKFLNAFRRIQNEKNEESKSESSELKCYVCALGCDFIIIMMMTMVMVMVMVMMLVIMLKKTDIHVDQSAILKCLWKHEIFEFEIICICRHETNRIKRNGASIVGSGGGKGGGGGGSGGGGGGVGGGIYTYCPLGISEITTIWQKHLSTKQSIAARMTSITFILYRIPLGHSFINYSKNYKRLTLIVL
uniref:Uncharacterized protein n=1 Tax=Glossina pallidipes TaxID=7398 RepID=A0A1A9ZPE6_GLOPL